MATGSPATANSTAPQKHLPRCSLMWAFRRLFTAHHGPRRRGRQIRLRRHEAASRMKDTQMNTVLITGASRGIGRATALLAADRGWAVAVNYRDDAGAAAETA